MNNQLKTWKEIESVNEIDSLISLSYKQPVLIFKYSLTCGISFSAADQLTEKWVQEEMDHAALYRVNVKDSRPISLAIAEKLNIIHQSPQLILIMDGKAVWDRSHFKIEYDDMKKNIAAAK